MSDVVQVRNEVHARCLSFALACALAGYAEAYERALGREMRPVGFERWRMRVCAFALTLENLEA